MGSSSLSGMPGQPIHAPFRRRNNGSRAVTSPPGLRFHCVVPSGNRSMSIGSRLATTTKSELPGPTSWPPPGLTTPRVSPVQCRASTGKPGIRRRRSHRRRQRAGPGGRCCRLAVRRRRARRDQILQPSHHHICGPATLQAPRPVLAADRPFGAGDRRAAADRRPRHRRRPLGGRLLCKADALAGVMAGAGDGPATAGNVHRGQVRVAADRLNTARRRSAPDAERTWRCRGRASSPPGHWASGVAAGVGVATKAIAGAAATATANPPAMISRRAGNFMVAIVTLSVDLLTSYRRGDCMEAGRNLHAFAKFPVNIAYRFAQAKRTN